MFKLLTVISSMVVGVLVAGAILCAKVCADLTPLPDKQIQQQLKEHKLAFLLLNEMLKEDMGIQTIGPGLVNDKKDNYTGAGISKERYETYQQLLRETGVRNATRSASFEMWSNSPWGFLITQRVQQKVLYFQKDNGENDSQYHSNARLITEQGVETPNTSESNYELYRDTAAASRAGSDDQYYTDSVTVAPGWTIQYTEQSLQSAMGF